MNHENWCKLKCGDGEICPDSTYENGYCLNPQARELNIGKRKEQQKVEDREMVRVFVYGSLRKGFGNHDLIAHSRFAGEAETLPEYTMISLGGFPGVFVGGTTAIKGEVYECNLETVKRLDRLEGHPHFYKRTSIDLADGSAARAYLYQPPVTPKEIEKFEVKSGDWADWKKIPSRGIKF